MKKVLHIIPSTSIGGVPAVLENLVSKVNTVEHVIAGELLSNNIYFNSCASLRFYNLFIRGLSFATFYSLVKIIIKEKPDFIHSHGKGAGVYGRLMGLIFRRIKIIHTYHGFFNRFSGIKAKLYILFEKVALHITDIPIALTKSEANLLSIELNVNSNMFLVIPNFLNLLNLDQLPLEIRGGGRFKVVHVGRICRQKNQLDLLRIAKFFKNTNVDFYIIGYSLHEDQYYYDLLVKEIKRNSIGNVFFLGPLTNAYRYLKNFDLLISTSLWEGLPTILIEAFQLGMPVITSECVGSIDLVGDYLAVGVKFGEIEDYVEKIKYIQNNYSNLSKKVIDCQSKFLKNNFSDSYLLGCYTKVYQ